MVVKARLHIALADSGKKQADIAREVDVSTAAVTQWFSDNGKDKIDLKHKNLVNLAKCLEVSIAWLEGETNQKSERITPPSDSLVAGDKYSDTLNVSTRSGERNEGYVYVQSYEHWKGEVREETRFMSVPSKWLASSGYSAEQLKHIEMPDDSQSDRIRKGDVVAVNIQWGETLKNDALYAVMIGGRYTLRRTVFQANGSLVLRCRNAQYPDETVRSEDIQNLDILGEFAAFQGVSA